jgi:hypothetical protein
MTVAGPAPQRHRLLAISLKPDYGEPIRTLWVSATDGKPLELRDPGRDATGQPQVIRWPAYEVLPGADANQLLTLTGAHPSAAVDHNATDAADAEQRLQPTLDHNSYRRAQTSPAIGGRKPRGRHRRV